MKKLLIGSFLVWVIGVADVLANKNAPAISVSCNVLAATIRIEGELPGGQTGIMKDRKPVILTRDAQYTLVVTKPGYIPYRKSFTAGWSGVREKSVTLEKGYGPTDGKPWMADLEDGVEIQFVYVPEGSFMMGSMEGEEDEGPVRKVTFSRSFWMAKTEVTIQQFEQYFKDRGTVDWRYVLQNNEIEMPTGADYPVVYIEWTRAMDFCNWLTKKERRRGRLPEGYEYTLPTEAEWEYACRAGTTGDYAGDIDAMGWHKNNSTQYISPVAKKKPNAWGLYDMHGNVWEWCSDYWYASYSNAPTDGSQRGNAYDEYDVDRSRWTEPENLIRLVSDKHRVVRGGCWSYPERDCRSSNRYYHKPDYRINYLGFRPVLLWNPPTTKLKVFRKVDL